MIWLIARKDLPDGTRAGARFEATDAIAAILERAGAVRRADPDEQPATAPSRRHHKRRDLEAEP